MSKEYLLVEKSLSLKGTVDLCGAKNAVLVMMASLLLTRGKSTLKNVPSSADVLQMISLLKDLGAEVLFEPSTNILEVDTSNVNRYEVKPEVMNKMRASILVMGPLLACFNKARVALPGGCLIGARPIDYHIKGFRKLGVIFKEDKKYLNASFFPRRMNERIILEYPSVGATENFLMFAVLQAGTITIVNAALEPEVLDLVDALKKMGAKIFIEPGAVIRVEGVNNLFPIEHDVIVDRLEAGALLIAAAITGGEINLPTAYAYTMDIFLEKLLEMGHTVSIGKDGFGISLKSTNRPKAVNFKTGAYPGFPTDLQAPFMVAQCVAEGKSIIEETVFENRFMHVSQLQKMGAQIIVNGMKATVLGVEELYGSDVIASDIRASCALVLAGLVAENKTKVSGLSHWNRGYDRLEEKLMLLGGKVSLFDTAGPKGPKKEQSFSFYKSLNS
ncbi:UDP-N-acetylglucosamine 1-carboxyvinyltransferase [Candidatus Babeliales bacterium]|nr:UDP-N-acetylglucosamine 1-carboxyvinyltransferase [Candidatus Babeliales bacterium]